MVFKYISVISRLAVVNVKETRRKPQRDLPQVTDKLFHIILHHVLLAMSGILNHNYSGDRLSLHM